MCVPEQKCSQIAAAEQMTFAITASGGLRLAFLFISPLGLSRSTLHCKVQIVYKVKKKEKREEEEKKYGRQCIVSAVRAHGHNKMLAFYYFFDVVYDSAISFFLHFSAG